jgi:hypothetical protein
MEQVARLNTKMRKLTLQNFNSQSKGLFIYSIVSDFFALNNYL